MRMASARVASEGAKAGWRVPEDVEEALRIRGFSFSKLEEVAI